MQRAGVSVVLPVHGNAGTLVELCARLRAAFSGRPLQIIAVDDASPDGALAILQSLPVDVVALPRRCGQNAALLAGLRRAAFPISCVMDADLQDPPEDMVRIVERLERGDVQVVFSSRTTRWRAGPRLFRRTLRAMFPTLPETPCLCFALCAAARAALLTHAGDADYLVAVLGALALETASVPIDGGCHTPQPGSNPRPPSRCPRPVQFYLSVNKPRSIGRPYAFE